MRSTRGKIITFYSYKGGTGRSMALANVAWILASKGMRVLMVDWDLEAPGLHRYFHPFLKDKNLASSDGLLELVMKFEDAAVMPRAKQQQSAGQSVAGEDGSKLTAVVLTEPATPPQPTSPAGSDWYLPLAKLDGFTVPLAYSFPMEGILDLMPAGRQAPNYAARVNSFNWSGFYDRLGGGVFLEAVKANMRKNYDYILIDSRTGVSDTAGICTVQMPEILVVCFTYNIQSIEGAAAVAGSIRSQRQNADRGASRIPLRIFPVPMRVEQHVGDKDRLNRAREFAESSFSIFLDHLSSVRPDKYWGLSDVPYDPFYAFQEILTTVADRPGVKDSLLSSFEQLTSFLTDGEVSEQEPLSAEERERLKQEFLRGAKPRSVDKVLARNPSLKSLCDEVTARQKAWEETKRPEQLLDSLLIARMQEAIELLVAMLEDNAFREFWDRSRGTLRRQGVRNLVAAQATIILVLTAAVIVFNKQYLGPWQRQGMLLDFPILAMIGIVGAVTASLIRIPGGFLDSQKSMIRGGWFLLAMDCAIGAICGLLVALLFYGDMFPKGNISRWQGLLSAFFAGFVWRKVIPDFLEGVVSATKTSLDRRESYKRSLK